MPEACQIADSAPKIARQRNWALALLFLGGAINLFDRQIINILAQDIKRDLMVSDAQLGLLTGTAFGIFYSLFGIPLGRLADRVDRIKLISAALVTWSGFTAVCGLAANFTQLFLARMGVGVGEAGSQPASIALIPDMFPDRHRVTAISLLLVGGPVGSFLGLLAGGYVGATWGWRVAFFVAGVPGILLATVMLTTLRDVRQAKPGRDRTALPVMQTLREMVRRPRFRWLAIGLMCSSFLVYATGAWLPPFFIRSQDMSLTRIAGFAAVAVGAGGAIGTLCSGFLCDLLRPRIDHVESKAMMASFALAVPALVVTVLAPTATMAFVAWFSFNVMAFAWQGPTMSMLQKAVNETDRSMAIALASALAVIVSLGLGLPLVGLLSDGLTPLRGPRAIGEALLISIVCVAALGIFAHWRAMIARS